jgi:hypothetical protein
VEPAPTRATSGEPSHPDASLTPTRDQTPDDGRNDHARERSGLGAKAAWKTSAAPTSWALEVAVNAPTACTDPGQHGVIGESPTRE